MTVPLVRSRRSDGLGIPLGQGKAQEMGSPWGEARWGDGAWISHLEWVMPSMHLGSWGPAWGEKVSDASPWRLGPVVSPWNWVTSLSFHVNSGGVPNEVAVVTKATLGDMSTNARGHVLIQLCGD